MGLTMEYNDGQTPLDEDEKDGLLIPIITTRGDLDEFEQRNIEQAIQWTMMRSIKSGKILSESFICDLHRRMYGDVWEWAGNFRKTNKNIGVDKWQIVIELKCLLDDTKFWIENNIHPPEEIAIRFKHRLVSIHCFPNGNGRHSRLMADIIIEKVLKRPVFSWGAGNRTKLRDIRTEYLAAVRIADRGDMQPLLLFARS